MLLFDIKLALHGIIDIDVEPDVDFYQETDHYSFRHNDNSENEICKNECS